MDAHAGFKCFTTLLAHHIKKLETYFTLLYFWNFGQCDLDLNRELLCPNYQIKKKIRKKFVDPNFMKTCEELPMPNNHSDVP